VTRIARSKETTHSAGWHLGSLTLCCLLSCCALAPRRAPAQDAPSASVKIWEFSPYDVEVLYVFDDTVSASPLAQQVWLAQVKADLERTFQAAWNVRFSPLSGDLAPYCYVISTTLRSRNCRLKWRCQRPRRRMALRRPTIQANPTNYPSLTPSGCSQPR
jgi:hypothetical protein